MNTGGLTECGAVHSHVPGSSFLVMAEDLGREMGCCFSLSGDALSGPERLFFFFFWFLDPDLEKSAVYRGISWWNSMYVSMHGCVCVYVYMYACVYRHV